MAKPAWQRKSGGRAGRRKRGRRSRGRKWTFGLGFFRFGFRW